MTRRALFVCLLALLGAACSEAESLHDFGNVSVSDPRVEGELLIVDVLNETGETLCYFEDSLFYGKGSVEGLSENTALSRPAIGRGSLGEISLSLFNRPPSRLVEIPRGQGNISIKIEEGSLVRGGDDVSFALIFCESGDNGSFDYLIYQSKV